MGAWPRLGGRGQARWCAVGAWPRLGGRGHRDVGVAMGSWGVWLNGGGVAFPGPPPPPKSSPAAPQPQTNPPGCPLVFLGLLCLLLILLLLAGVFAVWCGMGGAIEGAYRGR